MFLKSLELYGFKSFADRTKLIFKPGVTAIVGPNGCGKSNIVDALRWVLGESNARSLRGEVMSDVIFSGTDKVKPMGMAEVEIVIANKDNLLPIEYSEISIKRRMYRSGESEFFINKKNVRLKDIHELFADTGIGKSAYSIMEQGNIDMLLSTHPEERMLIFEEAAGITRYKMRIKESYKKLNDTDENLIRVDLIINEVEKELRNLEKQSEKAEMYRKLKEKERDIGKLIMLKRAEKLKSDITENRAMKDDLLKEKDRIVKERIKYEDMIKERVDKIQEQESKIVNVKNEIYRYESEISTISSKINHLSERVEEYRLQLNQRLKKLDRLKLERGQLKEHRDRVIEELKVIKELVDSQEKKRENFKKEIEILEDRISGIIKEKKEIARKINAINNEVSELRQDLKIAVDKLLTELDTIKSRLVNSEKDKKRLVNDINSYFEKILRGIENYKKRLDDIDLTAGMGNASRLKNELKGELIKLKGYFENIKKNFDSLYVIQEDVTETIFGKEGIHTRKEKIENKIEELLLAEEQLKKKDNELYKELELNRKRRDEFARMVNKLELEIARNIEKITHLEDSIQRYDKNLQDNEDAIKDNEFDIESFNSRIDEFEAEIRKLQKEYDNCNKKKADLSEKTKSFNMTIDKMLKEIRDSERVLEKIRREEERIDSKLAVYESKIMELNVKLESLLEDFEERYGETMEFFRTKYFSSDSEHFKSEWNNYSLEALKNELNSIKSRLKELGHVNLLALEELKDVKKRYEYLNSQKEDLLKAKDDLNSIVSRTLEESKRKFSDNFSKIKLNFDKIFKRLFNGGKTDLYLTDKNDLFKSGVEIVVIPPGKRTRKKTLLSGGEKTLTAIALLFAIFMVRPSPFCFLDEVDHDLDEENVVRFLSLLKEFTDTTQFIVITHNRRTMEFADVIYGVTTETPGVSKVVSLDMMERAVG